jgi:assimilatory nitrate reductase catalytic subunit
MPWAGAKWVAWPTCSAPTATWPTRSTAPKWPRCGACRHVPDKPGKTAVEMFQAAADGEIKALWIACTNPAQSMPDQATVRRALSAPSLWWCKRPLPPPPPAICRPAAARHHLGRKRRHRDQQRTPHQPRARGRARTRHGTRHDWAIAATLRSGWKRAAPRPPRCSPTPVSTRRAPIGLERTPRIHPRARPGHHRHELRHARRARRPSNGRCAKVRQPT